MSTFTQPDLTWTKVAARWAQSPIVSLLVCIELVLFVFRARADRWWRSGHRLPVMPKSYADWRLKTAYGDWNPSWMQMLYDVHGFGTWLIAMRPYINHGKRESWRELEAATPSRQNRAKPG
jgi:hypothetical protein